MQIALTSLLGYSQPITVFSLIDINRLVTVIETVKVYCVAETKFLNIFHLKFVSQVVDIET
jgi:hypothetical protein